jgi:hypothetical protein
MAILATTSVPRQAALPRFLRQMIKAIDAALRLPDDLGVALFRPVPAHRCGLAYRLRPHKTRRNVVHGIVPIIFSIPNCRRQGFPPLWGSRMRLGVKMLEPVGDWLSTV